MAERAAALLARKKRTRVGHKASTTRLMNLATTALEAEETDLDQLVLYKERITDKVTTLRSLDDELAELVPEEELKEEIVQADEYLERIYGVLAKLNKKLGPISGGTTSTAAPPG